MNLQRQPLSPFGPASDNAPYLNRGRQRSSNTLNIFTQNRNPYALPTRSHHIEPYARYTSPLAPTLSHPAVNPYLALQPLYRPSAGHSGVTLTPALGQLSSLRSPKTGLLPHHSAFCIESCCRPDQERELERNYTALWRPADLPCSTSSSSCRTNKAGGYTFTTRDIVVRGHARVVRASYLVENAKFEADLTKYLDKKTTVQLPERVVDLLIGFINEDGYDNYDVVDEVTLNILAFNVGAKSVVDHSLKRLKEFSDGAHIDFTVLGRVSAMILMCSKVDKGLTAWLKKILEKDGKRVAQDLCRTREFGRILSERPELEIEMERLLELRPSPKDDGFRNL